MWHPRHPGGMGNETMSHHLNSQPWFPSLLTPALHAFMWQPSCKTASYDTLQEKPSVFGEKTSQWRAASRKVEQNYGSNMPLWDVHRWQSYALACIWPEVTECYTTHSLINFFFFVRHIIFISLRCFMRTILRTVTVYCTNLNLSSVLHKHHNTNC